MIQMVRTAAAFAAILGLLGYSTGFGQSSIDTAALAAADTVHVTGNASAGTAGDTRDVSDREQIDALYRIISAPSSMWHRPMFDSPSLKWRVEFLRAGRFLGAFEVGTNFLGLSDYLRPLSAGEQRRIAQLLGTTAKTDRQMDVGADTAGAAPLAYTRSTVGTMDRPR